MLRRLTLSINALHKEINDMRNRNCALRGMAIALLVAVCMCLASMANAAPDPANADAMYNGYLDTYLVNSGGQTYFTNSIDNRADNFEWTQAYEITGVEDAYERTKAADRQTLISNLVNTFITVNFTDNSSTNLSWDTWNDDLGWDSIALTRSYQITQDPTYLTDAENVWNEAYSRGWDTTLGGGIWENQNKGAKCTLSNLSFVPSGVLLYQATGNSAYLSDVESIYAWTRANLFNTSTGQANECVNSNGTVSLDTNVYNSGLFVNAAAYLYRVTGAQQYYNDALLAATFQVNAHPIMNVDYPNNGPFGADQFFRGLSNFARWNNLWNNYSTWFNNNCADAWNNRNTEYNVTWDDISSPTPTTGDLLSMETESPMVLRQVAQIQDMAVPFTFSGNYELLNARSNMALTVSGGSTANDAAVVQEPYTGASDQLWTLTATSGGYYQIKNVNSGLALNVGGNFSQSFQEGAKVIQYTPEAAGGEDNDEWMPILNSNGTYTFFNLNSEQALDDFGASTTAGNQYDQWVGNGETGQEFTLISH